MTKQFIGTAALAAVIATSVGGWGLTMRAQSAPAATTAYKLGTFERSGRVYVGLVLRDSQVVDIAAANAAFERANPAAPKLAAPGEMRTLIARYDTEWRARLTAIAGEVAAAKAVPAYAAPITELRVHPPVRPSLILNAGGNYVEHTEGIASQQQRAGAPAEKPSPARSAPGIWERPSGDTRDNPYLFQKSPTVVSGANDPIVIPRGRTNIDFECEVALVVGRPAKYVAIANANDHIFGYTVQIDVSDRGGRGDRKMGGSDWLVGKNHDTFGPLGPFIVPKEFVKDPMNVRHTFTLNETVMQDSNTSRMSHNMFELLHYASNILTLGSGDIISGGSPAGTNIERAEPRWMRAGDTAICAVEGIGTQRHAVVAEGATR